MHRYLLPSAAAVVLLIVTALVQGHYTERWVKRPVTAEQQAFAERLDKLNQVAATVGDWISQEVPVDERQLNAARAVGSFSRRYQNKYDHNKIVSVFIVAGHPRDVTLHTPEQCYVLSGFKEEEEAHKYPVILSDSTAWFWTNRFRKGTSIEGPQHLRIFWTFSADGPWLSPTIARVELASAPALYKIYAITDVAGDSRERPEDSPATEFLREFMPLVNETLFAKEAPPGSEQPVSKASPASPAATTPAKSDAAP